LHAAEAVEEDPSTGADINADVHNANGDYEAQHSGAIHKPINEDGRISKVALS
jgi:hypothetical protein